MLCIRSLACCLVVFSADPALSAPHDRVALVIGNSAYPGEAYLKNPVNDARAMAETLRRDLNFDVIDGYDLTYAQLRDAVLDFAGQSRDADVAVIYYAGHGVADDAGRSYLVPIDAHLTRDHEIPAAAYSVDVIVDYAKRANTVSLIFLDACRNYPMLGETDTRATPQYRNLGRVPVNTNRGSTGVIVAYATEPGSVARDGDGVHSPFTAALLNHIATPNVEFTGLYGAISADVLDATDNTQQPHFDTMFSGSLILNPLETSPRLGAAKSLDIDPQILFEYAKSTDDIADYQAFLEAVPDGILANYARNAIARLERAQNQATEDNDGVNAPATAPPPEPTRPEGARIRLADLPLELAVTNAVMSADASLATERALDLDWRKRKEIQIRLDGIGIDTGPYDGVFGERTRRGIRNWQTAQGLPVTGYLNMSQIELLVASSEPAFASYMLANREALSPSHPPNAAATRPSDSNVTAEAQKPANPLNLLKKGTKIGLDFLSDKVLRMNENDQTAPAD